MGYSFLYITAKDRAEAKKIGGIIVGERLVACVNIMDGMESIYHWQGKIVEDTETVMIAKTIKENVGAVMARIRELHSYAIPCVIELPVVSGNPEYLAWISKETSVKLS